MGEADCHSRHPPAYTAPRCPPAWPAPPGPPLPFDVTPSPLPHPPAWPVPPGPLCCPPPRARAARAAAAPAPAGAAADPAAPPARAAGWAWAGAGAGGCVAGGWAAGQAAEQSGAAGRTRGLCQQTDWKQGITRSSDRGSGGAGSKLDGRQRAARQRTWRAGCGPPAPAAWGWRRAGP